MFSPTTFQMTNRPSTTKTTAITTTIINIFIKYIINNIFAFYNKINYYYNSSNIILDPSKICNNSNNHNIKNTNNKLSKIIKLLCWLYFLQHQRNFYNFLLKHLRQEIFHYNPLNTTAKQNIHNLTNTNLTVALRLPVTFKNNPFTTLVKYSINS